MNEKAPKRLEQIGPAAPAGPGPVRGLMARATIELDDTAQARRATRIGGSIGLFFLLLYMILDYRQHGAMPELTVRHLLILSGTLVFIGLSWERHFDRYWKAATLLFCVVILAYFIDTSIYLHDPESRFIAVMLVSVATASTIYWGPIWQGAMNGLCLLAYGVASFYYPVNDQYAAYRWLGMVATLMFSQYTAVFLDRHRRSLRHYLRQIERAAEFRAHQIATLAHDIRNPVSAVAGFLRLLREDEPDEATRSDLLARISSAINAIDALVSNSLIFYRYRLEEGQLQPHRRRVNPNAIIDEVVRTYRAEAGQRGVGLSLQAGEMPRLELDPVHLERMVANLLAYTMKNGAGGQVTLATLWHQDRFEVNLRRSGAGPAPEEAAAALSDPWSPASELAPALLGLHVVRALAAANGGSLAVRAGEGEAWWFAVGIPAAPASS